MTQLNFAAFLTVILLGFSAMTGNAADGQRVLFDFSQDEAAKRWQTVNDGVMGGVSKGRFTIAPDNTMRFFGKLSLENNGGFTSVRSRRKPLGLSLDDAITVRLRGDGRTYMLNLYVPTRRVAYSFRAELPTKRDQWLETTVPVREFYATSFGRKIRGADPVDADKVNSLGFMLSDKNPGTFELEIDWVKAGPENK